NTVNRPAAFAPLKDEHGHGLSRYRGIAQRWNICIQIAIVQLGMNPLQARLDLVDSSQRIRRIERARPESGPAPVIVTVSPGGFTKVRPVFVRAQSGRHRSATG